MTSPFGDDVAILELARKYCPYFQFSEKERYLPASFQHMCKHAPLIHDGETLRPGATVDDIRDSISRELRGEPPTLGHRLVWESTASAGHQGRDEKLHFDIGVVHENTLHEKAVAMLTGALDNDGYAGPPDPSNKLYGDPMAQKQYLNAHVMGRFACPETGVEMVDIVYGVYFMFNGTLESHAFDVEYVVLRFQYFDTAHPFGYNQQSPMVAAEEEEEGGARWHLVRAYLSAHGNGVWYPTRFPGEETSTLRFVDGTHPVVFSANASHAMYPSAKRHKRFMGFADDVTDERGLLWRATHLAVWGPAMFPVNPSTGAQERPTVKVLRLEGGASAAEEAVDPLLYLNFFRGTFGALQGEAGCLGCQSTLPFKEAVNLFTAGDGYYKFQKGGIHSVVNVGTSPAFRTGVHIINMGCLVAVLALLLLIHRQLGKGKSKEALRLVQWMWLPVVLGAFSAPVNILIRLS